MQQDAKKLVWTGTGEFKAMASHPENPAQKDPADLSGYVHPDVKAVLSFDLSVQARPAGPVKVRIDCIHPCLGEVDLTAVLDSLPMDTKSTLKIPLSCFAVAGTDFSIIDTAFLIKTDMAFTATIARVRWETGVAANAGMLTCAQVATPLPPAIDPLPGPSATLLGGAGLLGDLKADSWSSNGTHVSFVLVAGGYDLDFAADGANGIFILKGSGMNLGNYAAGTLRFDLRVFSYGTNAKGLAIKMESPGDGCRNVDYLLPQAARPPADGQVHTVTLQVVDVISEKNAPCFTLENTVAPFGIFPAWDDRQGVHSEVTNVQLDQ